MTNRENKLVQGKKIMKRGDWGRCKHTCTVSEREEGGGGNKMTRLHNIYRLSKK